MDGSQMCPSKAHSPFTDTEMATHLVYLSTHSSVRSYVRGSWTKTRKEKGESSWKQDMACWQAYLKGP